MAPRVPVPATGLTPITWPARGGLFCFSWLASALVARLTAIGGVGGRGTIFLQLLPITRVVWASHDEIEFAMCATLQTNPSGHDSMLLHVFFPCSQSPSCPSLTDHIYTNCNSYHCNPFGLFDK